MAVTHLVYGLALDHFLDADIDWTADTIKAALGSAYTVDQDAHDYFNDFEAAELAATGGYTAGGNQLDSPTRGYTGGTNVLKLDAADEAWASASFSTTDAAIYKDRGGATTADELISAIDFGGTETVTSGTLTLAWHTDGIITLTAA